MDLHPFYLTALERERMRRRRESGSPAPWTKDPIFAEWRFCNVRREDDRTTAWFRNCVRSRLSGVRAVEATVIFRLFNRIETGELIRDLLLNEWNSDEAFRRLQNQKPVVTGAYIVSSPPGYSKLEGILNIIDNALPVVRRTFSHDFVALADAWDALRDIPYLGRFHAYEMVSDLRWTNVLSHATDINTWANAGPGCARGLNRVMFGTTNGFNCGSAADQREMLALMAEILSESPRYWDSHWPAWEMREVEHWLCEFDKYERVRDGGTLKRRYR